MCYKINYQHSTEACTIVSHCGVTVNSELSAEVFDFIELLMKSLIQYQHVNNFP